MSQKKIYISNALGRRIAEESQLLAEEKWIIEALRKIKAQRNSLHIERLHLESMKAQLKVDSKPTSLMTREQQPVPSTSIVNLMKSASVPTTSNAETSACNEEICNNEQLNLCVTNSVFDINMDHGSFNMEEDDEEKDDEADLLIDMNMFMNGNTKK